MRKKRWPRFSDIFAFQPPSNESGRSSFESINDENIDSDESSPEQNSNLFDSPLASATKEMWNKIRFDNTIRLLISIPTYVACFAMWWGGSIASILPMTVVFTIFGSIQFCVTWFFMNNRFARKLDFLMSSFDIISMSVAIYCTGGANSPLYFIYFIPLIVHAFHRDWALVLFNGVGGSLLYASAILNSWSEYSSANLTNLGTRLFFMLLTLGIVDFAVRLLRKKDAADFLRLNRLRTLTLIGRKLNTVSALSELSSTISVLIKLINEGLGPQLSSWTRLLMTQGDPTILRSFADAALPRSDLKQELSAHLCPAMSTGKPFVLAELGVSTECPVENFSFGSHVCFPIIGTENESFGILFSGSPNSKVFNTDEKLYLQYVARSLAMAVQRLQRMEELKKAVEMNSCVMAAYIGSSRSIAETYKAILEGTATVLKADRASLMIWDAPDGLLRTVDVLGPRSMDEMNFVLKMGEGIGGRTLEKKEPYWTTDLNEKNGKALLCLPLLNLRGEPLGIITAIRVEKREGFSPTDVDTACTYAARAALAIENAALHQKEKSLLDSALKTRDNAQAA